jgi:hypothetical protein
MLEIVAVLLLSLVVFGFVVAPLLRSDAAESERIVAAESHAVDLHSKQSMLLASLKDLKDDRATGKLDESDYVQFEQQISAEAIEVMAQIEKLENAPTPTPELGPRSLTSEREAERGKPKP